MNKSSGTYNSDMALTWISHGKYESEMAHVHKCISHARMSHGLISSHARMSHGLI